MNPNAHQQLRVFGNQHNVYADYDPFFGKLVNKYREKRASNPKVQERKRRREERKQVNEQGPPDGPMPMEKMPTLSPQPIPVPSVAELQRPMTRGEARDHRNMNKARQEELKTQQEELKTQELEKELAQKDQQAANQQAKTALTLSTKNILVGVAVGGAILTLAVVLPKLMNKNTATADAPAVNT